MKTCNVCNQLKNKDDFSIHHQTDEGRVYLQSACRACTKEYSRTYYLDKAEQLKKQAARYRKENRNSMAKRVEKRRRENAEHVFELKSKSPCTDCGVVYPPYVMDFDHIGPKKKNVSGMVNAAYRLDTLKKEIAQCEVVCANCHRIRTFKRGQWKYLPR